MRWGIFAGMMGSLVAATPANAPASWTPGSIPWQRAAPNGTRYALLEGDRSIAGADFSYAFSIPAGVWDQPHSHSQTARVFVVHGVLWLGYGDHIDRRRAKAYPSGSFVVVPAGAVHFDGSDRDTVIIGVAKGAWSTHYLNGGAPASAGTPIKSPG